MIKGQTKADSVRKVGDYVASRLSGANKQESAIQAGYSGTTARIPSLIEHTKIYQSIVQEILTDNANTMRAISKSLKTKAESGELDQLRPLEQGQLYKIITDVNDKLIPKVTLKQSTDKNGNVTRTAWAQNASQVQEVLSDEGEYEGE